ncbi:MAG: dihydroneopterin aldolase [Ignavibacteria bacterium]|nr:dihydroneopterin aldolase [Ignavibacteria bacterium]
MKNNQIARLSIKGAQFYAYHGVKQAEKDLGGRYEVDLDLWYDATNAIQYDNVAYALNYEEAMNCIEETFADESFNLIETVASKILDFVFQKFPEVVEAKLRVRKINVPIHNVVSYIETELHRTRDEEENGST